MELNVGSIIEFSDKGRDRLGVILIDEGNQKRFRVLAEDGREVSVAAKEINLGLGRSLSARSSSQEVMVEALGGVRAEAEQAQEGCDVALLWEVALEEQGAGETVGLEALTELMYGDRAPIHQLGCLMMLREDDLYFKARGDRGFEVRSRDQIESMERAREIAAAREREQAAFVETLVEITGLEAGARGSRLAGLLEDAGARKRFEKLRRYAIDGNDGQTRDEAERLLDELEPLLPVRLEARRSLRAFELMVALGYWGPDENLWLLRRGVVAAFPEAAAEEAARLRWAGPERRGRLDLTGERLLTIDDEETRDIDDALSIEALEGGGWRVGVHIADPTHYVGLDSALELEARRRGTTIYLPEGRISMFPEALGEGTFSLVAGEARPALSFIAEFDMGMELRGYRVAASIVEVAHRLTYEEADAEIEHGEGALAEALRDLHTVSEMLAEGRRDNGAVQIPMPEVKVRVGADGAVTVSRIGQNGFSRELVSELMILTNTLAARYCQEHGLAAAYRVQDTPEGFPPEAHFEQLPEGLARSFELIRHMSPARTSARPGRHFGLGVEAYLQATSPIRRYSDLLTHFQIQSHLRDGRAALDEQGLGARITYSETGLADARVVSRETERYWLLRYLEAQGSRPLDAVVVSYFDETSDRASVVIEEVMMRVSMSTRRRVALGTTIQVEVERCVPRADVLQVRVIDVEG